ncbi:glycosyltransferase [Nodosilinea sp. FACHB-131]|uniref:glycosyltransferase family 4 protein n=1 Tax=Cyanophyceae TaxID=3028117 RepID=UPI001689BB1F|nr:glycosyltransferase [Nodosilinea sp. FACHB-131]MBD1872377.1 glycosyltransferase [Nodosilinea sp. FACHB-131]
MKPLNILISAYACQPHMGSEPGVGWHLAQEMAQHHQVWVLTRTSNQSAIEAELAQHPIDTLSFLYCDPPPVANWLPRAHVPHYYAWQVGAYFAAKAFLKTVDIDLIHHVTYVRYSTPSFLALLPVPFVWGPVGGGEMAPKSFWRDFSRRGQSYEIVRSLVHRVGELDPFTAMTARRSALVKATTPDTARRLQPFGVTQLKVESESGLSNQEIAQLSQCPTPSPTPFRFISMARLLHWKGLHLGLRAFAAAQLQPDAEYWILGEGPERASLQALAEQLGVAERVKFLGRLPRAETLQQLGQCHALVHASLHDSGGWVCLEAMAAGRPVICLDLGGPSVQVTAETGIKIPATDPVQTVQGLSTAMAKLAYAPELCHQMGAAGQRRVRQHFSWEAKGRELSQQYRAICQEVAPCAS